MNLILGYYSKWMSVYLIFSMVLGMHLKLAAMGSDTMSHEPNLFQKKRIDADTSCSLHDAAARGDDKTVKSLLQAGADKDALDSNNMTPLHWAARKGNVGSLLALLEAGASGGYVPDRTGFTPLHWAAFNDHLDCVEILTAWKSDLIDKPQYEFFTNKFFFERFELLYSDIGRKSDNKFLKADTVDELIGQLLIYLNKNQKVEEDIGRKIDLWFFEKMYKAVTLKNSECGNFRPFIARKVYSLAQSSHSLERLIKNPTDEEIEEADLLVQLISDSDQSKKIGRTPLHVAAMRGHRDCVEALCVAGANKDARSHDGSSPLHVAAENGHANVIEALVRAGADPYVQDNYGWTPLQLADAMGYTDCVKLLSQDSSSLVGGVVWAVNKNRKVGGELFMQKESSTMADNLHNAVRLGKIERVKEILARKKDEINVPDKRGYTPLHRAARMGRVDIIKVLLEHGAEIGKTGMYNALKVAFKVGSQGKHDLGDSPLHLAARWGHTDAVIALIQADADIEFPNYNFETPLHLAAKLGHLGVAKVLLRAGSSRNASNKEDNTALHFAAMEGHAAIVEILLLAGAHKNMKNKLGNTPLHVAAENGHLKTVVMLLNAGANQNLQNELGNIPLHGAAENNQIDVVNHLVQSGSQLDMQNVFGETPLHSASMRGYTAIVIALCKAGADKNFHSGTIMNWTPLHVASMGGHVGTVIALVEAGADIEAQDKSGRTPLFLAVSGIAEIDRIIDIFKEIARHHSDNKKEIPTSIEEEMQLTTNPREVMTWEKSSGYQYLYRRLGYDYIHNIKDHPRVVEALLQAGANTDAQDTSGSTALTYANNETAELLIEEGADTDKKDNAGLTPTLRALSHGNTALVNFLVTKGARTGIEARTVESFPRLTLLFREACKKGYASSVDLLLDHEAERLAVAERKLTAHQAALYLFGNQEVNDQVTHLAENKGIFENRMLFKRNNGTGCDLLMKNSSESIFHETLGLNLLLVLLLVMSYHV